MGPEALLIAATAATAVGAVSQGIAAHQAGQLQAESARRDAEVTARQSEFQEQRLRERLMRGVAAQRSAVGASGTTFEGSPLLLMAEAAENTELDILALRFGRDVSVNRSQTQAELDRLEGRAGLVSGGLRAGASILSTARQIKLGE